MGHRCPPKTAVSSRRAEELAPSYAGLQEVAASLLRERGLPWKATPGEVNERLVRVLWQEQRFAQGALETADGQRLEVVSPGWWNRQSGPDFLQAVIRLGPNSVLRGDVEVHLRSSDWNAHGHARDPRYNGVILHVILTRDREVIRNQRGDRIPELELSRFLQGEIGSLQEAIHWEDYPPCDPCPPGRCQPLLVGKGRETVGWLLDLAGDDFLQRKADRWAGMVGRVGYDELVYRGMMEALGYRGNQLPFLQLAERLPLRGLRRALEGLPPLPATLRLQAIFFQSAGFWRNERPDDPSLDEATRDYLRQLEEAGAGRAEELVDPSVPGLAWSFAGIRPANSPLRRLVGMSDFLTLHGKEGLFRSFLKDLKPARTRGSQQRPNAQEIFRGWVERLSPPGLSEYWSCRYAFRGKKLPSPARLIGPERAALLIVNVILPLSLLYAQRRRAPHLEEAVHGLYRAIPRLGDNGVLRFMRARLLGKAFGGRPALLANARRQHGLLQLYRDHCSPQGGECQGCDFLRLVEAL
ncbi:MAG: DUF2851 family protein [Candidatus Tectomicrobia bacterium]|uniref:DUF2851 family protein n=1 Tax=Tectimicrobiota bacterium TaxID=2528274 RepID=A0A932CQQ6_UNCTE|nr:DUF2851 family protein [Candidatus Tectomicrobia bacterium]